MERIEARLILIEQQIAQLEKENQILRTQIHLLQTWQDEKDQIESLEEFSAKLKGA